MEFSRQEYWRGLPFPPPADYPNSGIELESPESPVMAGWLLYIRGKGGSPLCTTCLQVKTKLFFKKCCIFSWPWTTWVCTTQVCLYLDFLDSRYHSTTRSKVGSIQEFGSVNTEESCIQDTEERHTWKTHYKLYTDFDCRALVSHIVQKFTDLEVFKRQSRFPNSPEIQPWYRMSK